MKKTFWAVILILCASLCIWGQSSSPIDLILLLDTSSAMSSSYENVNNYLSGAFLKEFLRIGDTFHLIAFSGNSRLDSARRIQGQGDLETIIARIFLQYPVERTSSVSSAISFTEQYISTLPNRAKKIVLVSAGANDTNNIVSAARARLRSNTTIDYIQVIPGQPLTNLPSSGRAVTSTGTTQRTATAGTTTGTAASASTSATSTTVTPTTTIATTTPTATTGTTTTSTTATTTSTTTTATPTTTTGTTTGITDTSTGTIAGTTMTGTAATGITSAGTNETSTTSGTSSTTSTGTNETGIATDTTTTGTTTTGTADTSTGNTTAGTTAAIADSASDKGFVTSLWFIILIIIFSLLLLALIIFLLSKRSSSGPQRAISQASAVAAKSSESAPVSSSEDKSKHDDRLSAYASAQSRRTTPYDNRTSNKPVVINPSGPLLLNLYVSDQNTLIGNRNIHSLKSGYKLTVGGGKNDDFLIFLVPMPSHIGEIKRNGSQLTFIPKKAKYFPEIGSNEVNDCINKTIRIVSDKGYDMRFRFEMYEDPLVSLNRMLMSVRVPG